ncbi:poly(A) RNA polymerase GLD2 [Ornithorhynchus anatinus]|uniref:Poly(A) RNA polymerase GLD2 n=1 Tax=Ornithorhynchus anatinus TaxID=9258 RepID=F7DZL8_ORNAN|nr:poly(A) RNA polymerase GLD2 [Ornithorhynchus anatinus]XP_028922854.1 poly(A) RNA polymerase GLD2 [Ornithorhynchus anatinus]XP_028922861.1 poly(A) RNA polymerase GLD2 [Ornithorhynchus anatinus]XP_039767302.1 poly(A) RNA polymerase GLD2 [Ornithorhynchus anatinus]
MFPNSSNLGRPPFPLKNQQHNNFFGKLPLHLSPTLPPHQQILGAQANFQNADLSRAPLSGNLSPIPPGSSQPLLAFGNGSPIRSSVSPTFRGRKRLSSEQNVPYDVKRQRFHSPHHESTAVHPTVPLRDERRYSIPGAITPSLFPTHYIPDLVRCVPPLQETSFLEPREITLPVAKDKLSQQVLDLFQECQQQACDLKKKELCRTELQREIQRIYPQSRLFLVGSSLNGFGTRSSDGDLCLVVTEEPVNQKTEARYILSLVQNHFSTRLSSYIERPQLIRAKVPIVKFRDKVSCVEFDLNVNNVVGIRNTFLLRTYAYLENRVRPLVLVVKKWASHHDINDASRGTLNSYSLVLMVLHYLQTLPEPVLPSLQKKYPNSFSPSMQLHLVHQASCTIPPYLSKNGATLGDLLLGFLKYYATEFDWNSQMISVREAKAIPRPNGIEWRNKFICVEEPFDGTNTARAVHEKQKFDMIKDEFLKSWHRLHNVRDLNSILPLRATIQKR